MDPSTVGRRYADRSVLVVGASTGIGLATAIRLATEGARVVVADLALEDAEAAAATLPGSGHLPVSLDVLDPDSVSAALELVRNELGSLDALVHVAGGARSHGEFEQTGDDVWRGMFELNLLGPVRVIRECLPLVRAGRPDAAVVVISSINAQLNAGDEPYSAAKAGLVPLITSLAAELGPEGIRLNGIAPGTIRTRVWDAQGGPDRLAHHYPLGRVGEPDDIAAAVAFLASADAAWITGHVLPVDGGLRVRRVI